MLNTIPIQNTTFFALNPDRREPNNLSAPLFVKLPDCKTLKIGSILAFGVWKIKSG
jgi:hypothetical protein